MEEFSFNEKLIAIVEENPLLYDIFNRDYKNPVKTSKLWKKISSEMGTSSKLLIWFTNEHFHLFWPGICRCCS